MKLQISSIDRRHLQQTNFPLRNSHYLQQAHLPSLLTHLTSRIKARRQDRSVRHRMSASNAKSSCHLFELPILSSRSVSHASSLNGATSSSSRGGLQVSSSPTTWVDTRAVPVARPSLSSRTTLESLNTPKLKRYKFWGTYYQQKTARYLIKHNFRNSLQPIKRPNFSLKPRSTDCKRTSTWSVGANRRPGTAS